MTLKDEINLPLALQDYLPVTLFAVGLFFVARMIARENKDAGNLAFLGGVLVTLGGFFKASWKLIQALGGEDIPLFNNSLFVLMSAGFICLAWALHRSLKNNSAVWLWAFPLVLIAVFWATAGYFAFFTPSRIWFFILLGATTVFNLWLTGQLIFRAGKNGLWLAVALFAVNVICVLSLSRISDQSVTLQWIKQLINTFSQGAFAVAAYILARYSSGKMR
jgi:hypothetical protein